MCHACVDSSSRGARETSATRYALRLLRRASSSAQHPDVCALRASLGSQRRRNGRPSAPARNPSSDERQAHPRRPGRECARAAPRVRLLLVRLSFWPSPNLSSESAGSVAVGTYVRDRGSSCSRRFRRAIERRADVRGWPRMLPASSRTCPSRALSSPPSLRRARISEVEKAGLRWLERYVTEQSRGSSTSL
jgi:hypothetical protein